MEVAFLTTAEMKTALAVRLGQATSATNPAHWDAVAADVVTSGYNAIVGALTTRGFSAAQIAAWDRGAEFNRRVGLCHFLRENAATGNYDNAAIDRVCKCEEELLTVPVTIAGAIVRPAGDRVGYGTYLDDDDDRHAIDNTLQGL